MKQTLFLFLFLLGCSAKPPVQASKDSRMLEEGACAKPDQRDHCIDLLREMATQDRWTAFEGSFKEFCTDGGGKCGVAKNRKADLKPPFDLKGSGESLFMRYHPNGDVSYYYISQP